jgi:hypothetical protein
MKLLFPSVLALVAALLLPGCADGDSLVEPRGHEASAVGTFNPVVPQRRDSRMGAPDLDRGFY